MGKIIKTFYDELIASEPDRTPNRLFAYHRHNDGNVGIWFRNFSFKLTPQEAKEWARLFREAKTKVDELQTTKPIYDGE